MPPRAKKATGIREVAAAAGVSVSTVSLAYNQKGRVSPQTRELVLTAGRKLGYRPNRLAQALQSGRSQVIGIVVGYRDSPVWVQTYLPYFRDVIAGAALEAVDHGYTIAAIPVRGDGTIDTSVPLDGVVIVDPVVGDALTKWCLDHFDAVVTDGRYVDGHRELLSVRVDMERAIPQLLDQMQSERRGVGGLGDPETLPVGLLIGERMDSYTSDTVSAYLAWCEMHGIEPRIETCAHDEAPEAAAARLLADDGLQAVHCLNETYGFATVSVADRLGKRVPEDLQVSMRGDAHAVNVEPRATYLSVDTVQAGALSARLLIALLEGERAVSCVQPFSIVPPAVRRGSSFRASDT